MKTRIIEASQNQASGWNWGKFLIGEFDDDEWAYQSQIAAGYPLLSSRGHARSHRLVLDLETCEGAIFGPGGSARADLRKHAVWVCPLFEPFLQWIYTQPQPIDLDALPAVVELPGVEPAMAGYRRDPAEARAEVLRAVFSMTDSTVKEKLRTTMDAAEIATLADALGCEPEGIDWG